METFGIIFIITILGAVLPSLNHELEGDYNILSGFINIIIISLIVGLGVPGVGWTFGQLALITIIFAIINTAITIKLAFEFIWPIGYTIVLTALLIIIHLSGFGETLLQQVQ